MSALARHIPLDEYLHNSAYKHCEYVSGEVVELNLGTGRHSRLQTRCWSILDRALHESKLGCAYVEVHCRLNIAGEIRYRLPDVCVKLGSFIEGYMEGAPDLCVEVRSPEDSIAGQIGKFDDYFANGCRLGWLILPEQRQVRVLRPGQSAQTAGFHDSIDAAPVLPALCVPVSDLFA